MSLAKKIGVECCLNNLCPIKNENEPMIVKKCSNFLFDGRSEGCFLLCDDFDKMKDSFG